MKKNIFLGLIMTFGCWLASAGDYIVKYRMAGGLGVGLVNEVQVLDHYEKGKWYKVRIDERKRTQTLIGFFSNPNIEYIVPDAHFYPVESFQWWWSKKQWALETVHAKKAWELAGNRGSKSVTVAVIDSGVDLNHVALAGNILPGYDFASNDADPTDEVSNHNVGHGTHCAGVIGATGPNGGTLGMSPDVSILPLRFITKSGFGDMSDAIKAIDYAIEHHAHIISASWASVLTIDLAMPIIEAVQRSEKAGIIFVAAAGNFARNNDHLELYPARAGTSNLIVVAASNAKDRKPQWSDYGQATVDLAAPGDSIRSTLPNNKYGNLSGTSMATPLVAGLLAFLKAQNPSLKPAEYKSLLQATGQKVDIVSGCNCRVDALKATEAILSKYPFVHPQAATMQIGEVLNFGLVNGSGQLSFQSSDTSIAEVNDQGDLTAKAKGSVIVSIVNGDGLTLKSNTIWILGDE